ncbi:MAG: hypothetical protein ABMA01_17935 [Chthoniobacteraceae bacterium]
MIDVQELKTRVAARAEDFLRELYGDKLHRAGTDSWRVGKKDSLALNIKDGELVYFDHESCKGGDCIGVWARERGGDNGIALKECAAWAGVSDDGTLTTPPAKPTPAPGDRKAQLTTRPPSWPMLDARHLALWHLGIARLESDEGARRSIADWRGWPEGGVRVLARAYLLSAPVFDLWQSFIEPQPCAAFRVLHPAEVIGDNGEVFWASRPVQLHVRFHPRATKCDGSPVSWIYVPTKKQHGMHDGANAPLIISRDGRDPEQPGYGTRCECVIVCAGEWDALSVLLASGWIDHNGTLTLPPGVAMVGIRGEGRGGTDAYLRHYQHWRPRSVIMLADADKTGLSWFESQDGRPCFAEQIKKRGAKVIRLTPAGHKDINDLFRTGNLGPPQIEDMLAEAGFHLPKGGRL